MYCYVELKPCTFTVDGHHVYDRTTHIFLLLRAPARDEGASGMRRQRVSEVRHLSHASSGRSRLRRLAGKVYFMTLTVLRLRARGDN